MEITCMVYIGRIIRVAHGRKKTVYEGDFLKQEMWI